MSAFSEFLQTVPAFQNVTEAVLRGRFPLGILGLAPMAKHLILHTLCEQYAHGALVVLPDDRSARKCCDDLVSLGTKAVFCPARDFVFRAESSSSEYEQQRIAALSAVLEDPQTVLVCSAESALQRTIPPGILRERMFTLRRDQTIEKETVLRMLVQAGYTPAQMVEGPGQFSARGYLLDVFPANAALPVRIEFFDNQIDTISPFDVRSQRRQDPVEAVSVAPCREVLFPDEAAMATALEALKKKIGGKKAPVVRESIEKDLSLIRGGVLPGALDRYFAAAYETFASPLDYCTEGLFFVCDTLAVKERANDAVKQLNEDIKLLLESGVLCRALCELSRDFSALTAAYGERNTVFLENFARGSFDVPIKELMSFEINQISRWNGSYKTLLEDLAPQRSADAAVVLYAGTPRSAQAVYRDLTEDGCPAVYSDALPSRFQRGAVNVLPGALSAGLEFPAAELMLIAFGRDLYNGKLTEPKRARRRPNAFNSLEELSPGDYVVHQTCGIGIFRGIEKMQVEGVYKDYIKIAYAKGDLLYVPVTKLEILSKYIGAGTEEGGKPVKINRLGTGDWQKTTARVKKAVRDIAADLIRLYAQRESEKGYPFSPDIDMQSDFERRFPYDETEDQLRCIFEIKRDMERPCPMDRLLCGDVGFGKTEVALRAAFKAVCDGKQVAILVPTTILAMQHYRTILTRLEGFPVQADMISRFRTPKEQAATLRQLRAGQIDILVGTHRLISKDVAFRDLGLLIVDEEQRFGVAQKETLKAKFPAVDVLTLSATPIPRTLNFAMMGIRDLSVIEEAPADRFPVQTYVVEHDWGFLSTAIEKELRRGGQVYYLHNRVGDIEDRSAKLRELFPEARIAVVHGKMNEEQISAVWQALVDGEIDILVCTTIIETGVDVPNVNTLIIENADRMGLAQLHQLRGRVGRSSRRASAYFTFTPGKEITEIAEKRLSAIREFTQFGSGFKIAMRDLEIRGAGTLLGAEQHGHMAAVGYDMYLQILGEAVEELKSGKPAEKRRDCLVDIHIDAHIPESYIPSYPQRIAAYKRIADIHTPEDASDVTDELIDRYGDPPQGVMGLIKVALLKNSAADNGFTEITQRDNALILYTGALTPETMAKLAVLRPRVSATNGARPYYAVRLAPKQSPLSCMEEIVHALCAELPA